MLIHDKKKAMGMIMSKMDGGGKDLPAEHGEHDNEELTVLASHVRAALQSGDDARLAEALMTFYQNCDQDEE